MNEQLKVEYLLNDITIIRNMSQFELAALLLDEGVLLLSVNNDKICHIRKRKRKK
ncbi:hypothetical protein acsn021_04080 [Anaerocolumna cellulosilytica]|uniref:Uncharacterized protein n=1 Tax=Anaerocolumna cellulosilytica TaxID=433286 RepID=A0A6S6QUT2_9FIRM|nr:hypothetical protein [Anaerocolumna cellulosilytica]MBB5197396.1 hypothetical protein [Anaerocolumna cellulosilytica]BCJ92839.1 hypothetical protein acsn021_04080 [Anaerocolumna cellulosilytica]